MRKLATLVTLLLFAATIPAFADPVEDPVEDVDDGIGFRCFDQLDAARPLTLQDSGATGQYAVPEGAATTLIVFGHGYSHISDSWVAHMKRAATDHGVISVTMDYRGSYKDSSGGNRGWFVKEGAEDMVAAAHLFQDSCDTIEQTIIFGVSMGGNSTGLAVAQAAGDENATGGPLFDYWFDIEGAVNVLETYAGASVLAPANEFAAHAAADIEDEMNGTLADDPEGYADLAVVNHIDEIAESGLKGVVLVHAMEDGLVPYNQSREFVPMLVQAGLSTEMYTAASKQDGEGGTTITSYSPWKDSPFAGHASETSTTHIVMKTALSRLWALVDDGAEVAAYAELFVDDPGTLPLL